VPEDKVVVLGLVSTKTPHLETRQELQARIHQAALCFPLDRLALSPQCGFASSIGGNHISTEVQKRKLHLVAETAQTVWNE